MNKCELMQFTLVVVERNIKVVAAIEIKIAYTMKCIRAANALHTGLIPPQQDVENATKSMIYKNSKTGAYQ